MFEKRMVAKKQVCKWYGLRVMLRLYIYDDCRGEKREKHFFLLAGERGGLFFLLVEGPMHFSLHRGRERKIIFFSSNVTTDPQEYTDTQGELSAKYNSDRLKDNCVCLPGTP
jgi:hypothetical protein